MNILLTGATGFLGRAARQMLGQTFPSANIIGVSRRETKIAGDVICDLSDKKQLARLSSHIDCIVHLAAYVPAIERNAEPDAAYQNNVKATLNLLEFAARQKISNFVLGSSCAIYGAHDAPMPVAEDVVSQPNNFYALSKRSAEMLACPYIFAYGMKIKTLRFSYIYGIGMRESTVICKFIDTALTNEPLNIINEGRDYFDLVHVLDAATAICAAVSHVSDGVFNIGSGKACTLKTLAETVLQVVSSSSRIHFQPAKGEGRGLCLDIQKAQHALKWQPKVSLIEGIQALAQYRKYPQD